MQMPIFRAAAFAALLFTGCVTTPPDPLLLLPPSGKAAVTSSVPGAAIVADGAVTGMVTPDTLTLTAGTHTLGVSLTGFASATRQVAIKKNEVQDVRFVLTAQPVQRLVLLEDFGNVSCVPCSLSNLILEAVKANTYGGSKLAVVKYPINFPLPTDPFYLHAKDYSTPRISYYNVFSAPTTIVDGVLKPKSSDSADIKNAIATRLAVTPKVLLTAADTVVGGNLQVTVRVTPLDTSGVAGAQLVLHTAITETDFNFTTPPGSNGETRFYDVMRAMLPTGSGEAVNLTSPGQTAVYNRSVPINAAWNMQHVRVIVFIQDRITKEILQAAATRQ